MRIPERGHGRIEPGRFTPARNLPEAQESRTEWAIAVRFGAQYRGQGPSGRLFGFDRLVFSPRIPRHHPLAPSWSRAAGIAARGDAAHVGPDVRTGPVRSSIAARQDR